MHLQKHCVVISRGFSGKINTKLFGKDVSSLSMCHNNMQYSYPELFIPDFALPISTSSFLALTSQRSSVTTYETWKS